MHRRSAGVCVSIIIKSLKYSIFPIVVQRRRVVIPNSHGEKLVGILHETGSKQLVIVCHGFQSTKVGRSEKSYASYYSTIIRIYLLLVQFGEFWVCIPNCEFASEVFTHLRTNCGFQFINIVRSVSYQFWNWGWFSKRDVLSVGSNPYGEPCCCFGKRRNQCLPLRLFWEWVGWLQ